MRGRGLPHWWALPLEMLSTCTCYSRLHWRWFGYVSPSYCTTWPSLILAHFRFLLDHVSGPSCSTCQFSTGTYVVLWLDHVSLLHWTMCHIFIGPRGRFLFDHMSRRCPSMFHVFIWPCGFRLPSTCWILIAHMSSPGYCTCHALVRPCVAFYLFTWPVLVLPRGVQLIRHRSNSRSLLLYRLTT